MVNVLKDVAIKGIDTIDKGIGVAKDISKDTIKSYDDCTKAILEEAEKDEYGFEEKKELYSAAENIVDKEAIEGDKLRSFIIEVLPWAYRTIIAICVTTCAITGAKSIIPLFATDK